MTRIIETTPPVSFKFNVLETLTHSLSIFSLPDPRVQISGVREDGGAHGESWGDSLRFLCCRRWCILHGHRFLCRERYQRRGYYTFLASFLPLIVVNFILLQFNFSSSSASPTRLILSKPLRGGNWEVMPCGSCQGLMGWGSSRLWSRRTDENWKGSIWACKKGTAAFSKFDILLYFSSDEQFFDRCFYAILRDLAF